MLQNFIAKERLARGEAEIKWRKWVGGTGAFWASEKTFGRSAKKKHNNLIQLDHSRSKHSFYFKQGSF